MKWLRYKPQYCLGCRCCMTVEGEENVNCRILIDMIKRGGPKFYHEECAKSGCTECIDICGGHALYKK